ncbi:hypothetical protein G5S37_27810 [Roseimicrobium sp. ORNL1]|nr:hypothetical protein G5S37_27810 [Roseimicrobium sp. ORNL1]
MVLGVPSVKGRDPYDATTPEELAGTWTAKVGETEHFITFAADGTFRGKSYHRSVLADEYTGTWKLERTSAWKKDWDGFVPHKLSYVYLTSKVIPAGTKDEDVIFDRGLDKDTQSRVLRYMTKSGVKRFYTKVGK